MKTKLLAFIFLVATSAIMAQTTHNLDWFTGIGTDVDLTISQGDTVIWTWTNPNHTVESASGSAEDFDSGFLMETGSTFSHTFTVVGSNPYFCGIHGAASMSGTITVETLGVEEFNANDTFTILPNPSSSEMNITLPSSIETSTVRVFDLLGKRVLEKELTSQQKVTIDVSKWNSGIYIVRVSSDALTQTKRFVKQ